MRISETSIGGKEEAHLPPFLRKVLLLQQQTPDIWQYPAFCQHELLESAFGFKPVIGQWNNREVQV